MKMRNKQAAMYIQNVAALKIEFLGRFKKLEFGLDQKLEDAEKFIHESIEKSISE